MLYLISLGLYDEKDMSIHAVETAKKCDKLYAEFYTTGMRTTPGKISKLIGKPVSEISRPGLEEQSEKIISEARTKNIGVLVGGDALSATTHSSLLLDAKKLGIAVKVIHGSSILTAVAETGLQLYKFGRTVTLPKTGATPSIKEAINENRKAGLHTLILLDIGLSAKDALKILLGSKVFGENEGIIAACLLGSDSAAIKFGKISTLAGTGKDIDKTPAVLVVPGELHFMEKEMLEMLR